MLAWEVVVSLDSHKNSEGYIPAWLHRMLEGNLHMANHPAKLQRTLQFCEGPHLTHQVAKSEQQLVLMFRLPVSLGCSRNDKDFDGGHHERTNLPGLSSWC